MTANRNFEPWRQVATGEGAVEEWLLGRRCAVVAAGKGDCFRADSRWKGGLLQAAGNKKKMGAGKRKRVAVGSGGEMQVATGQ
ncbi:hypothetical protein MRB53_028781 [Persea americana]|uniref:Uncharacterized protein n=1 Tax=Persea americana TaxID=3435 RepID=A0ACC2KGZ8_PERAE|nr:hypothetical protein MRB53_028781 [Persea americana]